MSALELLLQQYQGQYVPVAFDASSAVTMGGIAIWCMHFIGNRAIELGNGEPELQIAYSSRFTALSFFIPILVLLTAFVAIGAENKVSWWRVSGGGCLAGGAICGMHYLGNASISNYTCVYEPVNIIGATLIAVAASTVSLSLFFVFRASWTNSWWRRALSAVVLAGAVSGMHWCASTGTQYRLISLNSENSQSSRSSTVIVVICLSIGAAFITAGIAMYTAHVKRRYAHKAQQVVLAAAVFDKSGRILASRNWNGLSKIIGGMTTHLAHLPRRGKDNEVRLIDDNGELIQNYDTIFCELFCLAAMNLAEETKEQLTEAGILWDEILPTGTGGASRQRIAGDDKLLERDRYGRPRKISDDLIEKGEAWGGRHQEYGRGSLMFLIRCVERPQDVERLEAAGYRFADIHQVSGIIASSMQIKANDFEGKLTNMATYAGDNIMLDPGVHVGFFAVKARVGGLGFSIMVQKAARNLLPTVQMPLERLESWQVDIVRQLDQTRVPLLLEKLEALTMARSPQEKLFASQLQDAVEALQTWIDDPIFVEATLTSKLVQVPCRATAGK
ncbi:putative mhyt domain signaling protein [Eutypa lata UCREL1]|uniref:Putative mhyt domain signaling protein n=1 Tax=Eutypa lata (strain UCR-EL1) TaxID=1287681 RepID=M7TQ45_EUTLA|nr:putative mhyt domain signaling protein [Eutypa lata UCREL1]